MDREKLLQLGRLNAVQIAVLSVATSAFAALAVLFSLRRFIYRRPGTPDEDRRDDHAPEGHARDHFSEDMLVPGLTHTGPEILAEDGKIGRSAEGV
jgi:hypothetical protein